MHGTSNPTLGAVEREVPQFFICGFGGKEVEWKAAFREIVLVTLDD